MKKYLPVSAKTVSVKTLDDCAPLSLSIVGDSVHTLFLRTVFLAKDPYDNNSLHRDVALYACAPSQAEYAKKLFPLLTDDEKKIFNKAKNGKINTIPKHATRYQYQLSTAFEAVTGYLYLSAQNDRLAELYTEIYKDTLPEIAVSDTETKITADFGEEEK